MSAETISTVRTPTLAGGLARSLMLHAVLVGLAVGWGFWTAGKSETWGDPNANPGAGFAITPVNRIPMPMRQGRPNPVANDAESQVAREEFDKRKQDRREKDERDAIELRTERMKKTQAERAADNQRYRPEERYRDNQLKTTTGQALTNPMYGTPGAGGVGIGTGTPFGTRFGAYAELLRRRIAEKWRTNDVDPYIREARPVTVSFEILRNGTVRDIQIVQRSGVLSLDYSAQRAVMEAAPFEPLPREFARDSANVEFTFQLQR
jgi:periplasmic protein TonB